MHQLAVGVGADIAVVVDDRDVSPLAQRRHIAGVDPEPAGTRVGEGPLDRPVGEPRDLVLAFPVDDDPGARRADPGLDRELRPGIEGRPEPDVHGVVEAVEPQRGRGAGLVRDRRDDGRRVGVEPNKDALALAGGESERPGADDDDPADRVGRVAQLHAAVLEPGVERRRGKRVRGQRRIERRLDVGGQIRRVGIGIGRALRNRDRDFDHVAVRRAELQREREIDGQPPVRGGGIGREEADEASALLDRGHEEVLRAVVQRVALEAEDAERGQHRLDSAQPHRVGHDEAIGRVGEHDLQLGAEGADGDDAEALPLAARERRPGRRDLLVDRVGEAGRTHEHDLTVGQRVGRSQERDVAVGGVQAGADGEELRVLGDQRDVHLVGAERRQRQRRATEPRFVREAALQQRALEGRLADAELRIVQRLIREVREDQQVVAGEIVDQAGDAAVHPDQRERRARGCIGEHLAGQQGSAVRRQQSEGRGAAPETRNVRRGDGARAGDEGVVGPGSAERLETRVDRGDGDRERPERRNRDELDRERREQPRVLTEDEAP